MILDEPTVGLDIKAQIEFIELLRKIAKGRTIILITHHLEEIFEEISHVVLLKEGRIYQQGKKEKLLSDEHLSFTFGVPLHVSVQKGRYVIESVDEITQ
jgi:iron complex transport system ATP-binding protein